METSVEFNTDQQGLLRCACELHLTLMKMQETLKNFRKNKLEELKSDMTVNQRRVINSKGKFWILQKQSEALLECSKRMHQSHLNSVLHRCNDSSAAVTHDIKKSLSPKDNVTFQHCINTMSEFQTTTVPIGVFMEKFHQPLLERCRNHCHCKKFQKKQDSDKDNSTHEL